jgi:ketosteroid isomerase-like protein
MKDFLISSAAAKVQVKSVMHLTSALLFSACACLAATCQRTLPANLKKDVDAGNQAWVDGLKAGDANRIVFGYSQDSVNCDAAGDCVKGRMAVAAQYKEVIGRFGRATSGFVRSETLHVDQDLAYESGHAEARFSTALSAGGGSVQCGSAKVTDTGRSFATSRCRPFPDNSVPTVNYDRSRSPRLPS